VVAVDGPVGHALVHGAAQVAGSIAASHHMGLVPPAILLQCLSDQTDQTAVTDAELLNVWERQRHVVGSGMVVANGRLVLSCIHVRWDADQLSMITRSIIIVRYCGLPGPG
jgi:hypothetical protein